MLLERAQAADTFGVGTILQVPLGGVEARSRVRFAFRDSADMLGLREQLEWRLFSFSNGTYTVRIGVSLVGEKDKA